MPWPNVLSTPPPITRGKHARRFHAPRAFHSFTNDPSCFQTEKDPRGKVSNVWFDLPPPTGSPPYHLDLSSILSDDAIKKSLPGKGSSFTRSVTPVT